MRRQIKALISWPAPLHRQKALGLGNFDLPVTERVSREVVSLHMHPELTDEEAEMVIDAVRGFFK